MNGYPGESAGYRSEPPRRRSAFSPARLWTGGVVTALIAAGIVVVGFLVVRAVLQVPILGFRTDAATYLPSMIGYALGAVIAALLATGVMHLLVVGTPRPLFYFGWIGALCTAILVLLPLGVHPVWNWSEILPTAVIHLVLGIAITAIVRGTAAASIAPHRQGAL